MAYYRIVWLDLSVQWSSCFCTSIAHIQPRWCWKNRQVKNILMRSSLALSLHIFPLPFAPSPPRPKILLLHLPLIFSFLSIFRSAKENWWFCFGNRFDFWNITFFLTNQTKQYFLYETKKQSILRRTDDITKNGAVRQESPFGIKFVVKRT